MSYSTFIDRKQRPGPEQIELARAAYSPESEELHNLYGKKHGWALRVRSRVAPARGQPRSGLAGDLSKQER